MLCAFHPPRRVPEMGRDPPQRNKEPAPLRQLIIARRRLLTLRAPTPHAAMRLQANFDSPAAAPAHPAVEPLAKQNLQSVVFGSESF
jgi:hypothetical protein